jgi:lipoprotein NlpI
MRTTIPPALELDDLVRTSRCLARSAAPRHNAAQQMLAVLAITALLQARAGVDALLDSAIDDFLHGQVAASVEKFDRAAAQSPAAAPYLWQRGIALYYAGRYADCRRQFESHRTVNPDDVENAAWHFLCVARAESPRAARAALLPVGPDARAPMREVYRMLSGEMTPEAVLAAAGNRPDAQFFAHLYTGLYFEATGNARRALEQIAAAAEPRYSAAGYMHAVAKIHLSRLQQ